jgi:hypothetical protein
MIERKEIRVEYRNTGRNPKWKWRTLSYQVKSESTVERRMRRLGEKYKHKETVYIDYYVFNEISKTWMCLASYYTEENRFVKH